MSGQIIPGVGIYNDSATGNGQVIYGFYTDQAAAAATTKLLKLPKEWHPGFSTKVKPTVPVVLIGLIQYPKN